VEGGTGLRARIDGYAVAGKTGTAQKVDPGTGRYSAWRYMSSFVGFVPAQTPRLVILVVVDSPRKGHYGGEVAAPVFRAIAVDALCRLGVPPSEPPSPEPSRIPLPGVRRAALHLPAVAPQRSTVPNFFGFGLRDALVRAQRQGWDVRVRGSGYVIRQEPPPGAILSRGSILLEFGSGVD